MPLPISVCKVAGDYDPSKAVNFKEVTVGNFTQLADIMLNDAWAPAILKYGYRKKENFLKAGFLGLDIDDGLSIAEAEKLFSRYKFIIGTTRSHQKQKGDKPPCDRYRIVIPCRSICTDLDDFEYTMAVMAKQFGVDPATLDAARFYFKCSTIAVCKEEGKPFTWMKLTDEEKAAIRAAKAERNEKQGLSRRGARILCGGEHDEGRHKSLFHAAADLGRSGFTIEDTIKAILTTPLAEELIYEKGRREVERNIANGYREGSQKG